MSGLVFLDSAAHDTSSATTHNKWNLSYRPTSISVGTGARGGNEAYFDGTDASAVYSQGRFVPLDTGQVAQTITAGFRYRAGTVAHFPASGAFVATLSPGPGTGRRQLVLRLLASGELALYSEVGASSQMFLIRGFVPGTLTGPLTHDYIEMQATWRTTGINDYYVRLNGTEVMHGTESASGFTATGANFQRGVGRSFAGSTLTDSYHYFSDQYIRSDDTWQGNTAVECQFPSAPGTSTATPFTPHGAANNWDCVNDATPDDDTTYVRGAVNEGETYVMSALGGGVGARFGVQWVAWTAATVNGTNHDYNIYYVQGALSDQTSIPTIVASTTYKYLPVHVFEQNPLTLEPWSASDFSTFEWGILYGGTSGGDLKVSQLVVEVGRWGPNRPTRIALIGV